MSRRSKRKNARKHPAHRKKNPVINRPPVKVTRAGFTGPYLL